MIAGLGRMSPLLIDNLGITVKAEDAYKRYAEKFGISADALTEQQKKQAFTNEVTDRRPSASRNWVSRP